MSLCREYPNSKLQAENDRLIALYKNQDRLSITQIIDKHASPEFKQYMQKAEEEAVLEQWHSDW